MQEKKNTLFRQNRIRIHTLNVINKHEETNFQIKTALTLVFQILIIKFMKQIFFTFPIVFDRGFFVCSLCNNSIIWKTVYDGIEKS